MSFLVMFVRRGEGDLGLFFLMIFHTVRLMDSLLPSVLPEHSKYYFSSKIIILLCTYCSLQHLSSQVV